MLLAIVDKASASDSLWPFSAGDSGKNGQMVIAVDRRVSRIVHEVSAHLHVHYQSSKMTAIIKSCP